MKKIYINGSYLSKNQQRRIFWKQEIYNTYNIYEHKPEKTKYYWIKYITKNFFINLKSKERKQCDIQIFNSIVWCLFYNAKKKNIIIIHWYDIWIGTEYLLKNTNSFIKKIIIKTAHFFLWKYIKKSIKKFDYVFAATYDRFLYIKKHINKNVTFLPNIIDIEEREKKYNKNILSWKSR